MKTQTIQEWISNYCDITPTTPKELEKSFLGLTQTKNGIVACYDYNESIRELQKLNKNEEEAVDYIESFIATAAFNNQAPLFINKYERV